MATDGGKVIQIQVIYALPGHIWRHTLELPAGATAQQALEASGLLQTYPELADSPPPMGIHGRVCQAGQVLQEGDRLEIYRPLVFDPMESRRRRAQHRQRQKDKPLSRA